MKSFHFLIALVGLLIGVEAFAVQTTLTVQTISETAAAATDNAADTSNGNRFINRDENVFLRLYNSDGSNSATVTITAADTSESIPGFGVMTKSDIAVSLSAGQIKFVGPFPRKAFNDSSEYVNMTITGTGAASVKITPLKVTGLVKQ